MVQIRNHLSKSEVVIQSKTALDAGETENQSMDQLEARHQREHKDARYFWIPDQVQDEDFSSTAMWFKLQDWYSTKTMDPTLHYKMKADEVYDGET